MAEKAEINAPAEVAKLTIHGVDVEFPREIDDWDIEVAELFFATTQGGGPRESQAFLAALFGAAKWKQVRRKVKTVRDLKQVGAQVLEALGLAEGE